MIAAALLLSLQTSLGLLDEGDCASERAVVTTIEQVNANPEAFDGRCVTIEGFASPLAIYASRDALEFATRALRGEMPAGRIDQRLQVGAYFRDMEEPRFRDYGTRWTVTGKLHVCSRVYREVEARAADRRAAATDEAGISMTFIPGYCHYYQGPAIVVVEADMELPPFEAQFEPGEIPPGLERSQDD